MLALAVVSVLLLLAPIGWAQLPTLLCDEGNIQNGSTVTALNEDSQINKCSMSDVTLRTEVSARLVVSTSTVKAGSLMRVVFGQIPFTVFIRSTTFERDARLVAEGTMFRGAGIQIWRSSFDVRTPFQGDTVAVDYKGLWDLPDEASLEIESTTFKIEAGSGAGAAGGLVAAVAWRPRSIIATELGSSSPVLTLIWSDISLNVTNAKAYGVYLVANGSMPRKPLLINSNRIYNPSSAPGSADVTAFLMHFPIISYYNFTATRTFVYRSLGTLEVVHNKVDRIGTFLQLVAMAEKVFIENNEHSHYGPILSNITLGAFVSDLNKFEFQQNAFRSFYEPWNPASTYANPTLIFAIPIIFPRETYLITHNEVVASRFGSIPFLFPGTTDLSANSTLYLFGNYFASGVVADSSLPMASFAIGALGPPRTVDLGVVYICSNTWPAAYVPATTTTSTTSTTAATGPTQSTLAPTTWATVPSVDTLSVLVAPTDRPANVSVSGGGCPTVFVTRIANGSPGKAAASLWGVLLLWVLGCVALL